MNLRKPLRCFLVAAIALTATLSFRAQPADQLKRASELFRQGTENYRNDRYDAAIADYTEYLKIRPTGSTAWYNRGLAYWQKAEAAMNRQDFERAEADFSQAIKLDPTDADFWLHRGHVRLRLVPVDFNRQVAQAIRDYTEAIKLKPTLSAAYRGRGQVYQEANRTVEAMADLNKALQLDPRDHVALFNRGKLFSFDNKYAAARNDLESAIRLFPQYEAAKSYLNFVNTNDPERKTPATALTARPPVVPVKVPTASGVTDPQSGYKAADDAARSGDHRKVIDAVTKTLPLIRMESEGLPADELMIHVYLNLLRMRARAYTSLKQFKDADGDYNRAATDAIKNMNRHNSRAVAELKAPSAIHSGGIMGGLQTGFSTILCKASFDSVSEWVASVDRNQADDMAARFTASILLGATREICAISFVMHGNFETLKSVPGSKARVGHLNTAVERYTEAIKYMQAYRAAYVERAKAYRELGRVELALVDEKKATELPVKK